MREYISRALILERETFGEYDERVNLFTEKFGKIRAKTVSSKKIKSKLSGHLEPGTISRVRFVEKRNLQLVDALKIASLGVSPVDMFRLSGILAEDQPDKELWRHLSERNFSWNKILEILGWSPAGASCACGGKPEYFEARRQDFSCLACKARQGYKNELAYIKLD